MCTSQILAFTLLVWYHHLKLCFSLHLNKSRWLHSSQIEGILWRTPAWFPLLLLISCTSHGCKYFRPYYLSYRLSASYCLDSYPCSLHLDCQSADQLTLWYSFFFAVSSYVAVQACFSWSYQYLLLASTYQARSLRVDSVCSTLLNLARVPDDKTMISNHRADLCLHTSFLLGVSLWFIPLVSYVKVRKAFDPQRFLHADCRKNAVSAQYSSQMDSITTSTRVCHIRAYLVNYLQVNLSANRCWMMTFSWFVFSPCSIL